MTASDPIYKEYSYIRPTTSDEAVNFLKQTVGQSVPFSGGTDCLIAIRDRKVHPRYLVDLKYVDGLDSFSFDRDKGLTIGAVVNLNKLIESEVVQAHYPVLAQAAGEVGGYQLRNRATLIGNICNASPCGDTIAASLLYKGVVNIIGTEGKKTFDLKSFFIGPHETILQPGEIVVSIDLPPPPPGIKGVYMSIGRNKLADLAIAAVTVLAFPDGSANSGFRFFIGLSAVAPTVMVDDEAQSLLTDQPISDVTLEKAALIAKNNCKPIDDIRASKKYRQEMIHSLTLSALRAVWNDVQRI